MITLEEFLKAGQYCIKEGGTYGWDCYGTSAYMLDVQKGDWKQNSASVVFDKDTQEVYEVTCYDYTNERAYRLFGSEALRAKHDAEAAKRGVDDQAWEAVKYTNLEVVEDFLEKMTAIINGSEYETKISIPLDLDKETMYQLMIQAHKRNITLNEMVEEILQFAIDRAELVKAAHD